MTPLHRQEAPAPGGQVKRLTAWILSAALLYFAASGSLVPFRYRAPIDKWADTRGLDPLLVASVVRCESGFRNKARSQAGALGLMQLMPETAVWLAQHEGILLELEALQDPDLNLRLGTRYLALLLERFEGDTVAALAAYNAGPTVVSTWRSPGQPLRMEQIRYPETRHYVKRVLSYRWWLNRFY